MNKEVVVTEKDMKRVAALIDNIVWADKEEARAQLSKMRNRLGVNVKCLARMLRKENDEATVKASFALEGLVFEVDNSDDMAYGPKLFRALIAALPEAADEYGLCVLLETIRRLGYCEPPEVLAPYLKMKDPVFTYALMAIEGTAQQTTEKENVRLLLETAKALKTDMRAKLLVGAAIRIAASLYEEAPQLFKGQKAKLKIGELETCSQSTIMLLDELSWIPDLLDFEDIKRALKSKSALVRGLGQRVLCNAVFSDYEAKDEFYDKVLALGVDYISVPIMRCMSEVNKKYNGIHPLSILVFSKLVKDGDPVLRRELYKVMSEANDTPFFTESLVDLANSLGDEEENVLFKIALLEILGQRGDRTATVYVMTQLKSKCEIVREVSKKAARALGVSEKLIDAQAR